MIILLASRELLQAKLSQRCNFLCCRFCLVPTQEYKTCHHTIFVMGFSSVLFWKRPWILDGFCKRHFRRWLGRSWGLVNVIFFVLEWTMHEWRHFIQWRWSNSRTNPPGRNRSCTSSTWQGIIFIYFLPEDLILVFGIPFWFSRPFWHPWIRQQNSCGGLM